MRRSIFEMKRVRAERRLRAILGMSGFIADRRGVAAVEFALILPFMLLLYVGVVEITQYVAADRKAAIFARTLSDLTAQPTIDAVTTSPTASLAIFDDASRSNVFGFSASILFPFAPTNAAMRITQFAIDNNSGVPRAFIDWMETCTWQANSTCTYGSNANFSGPTGRCAIDTGLTSELLAPNAYLIRGEVTFHYTPILAGLFLPGGDGKAAYYDFISADGIQLNSTTFARPRSNTPIIRKYSDGSSTYRKANGTTPNDAPTVCPGFKP